MKPKLKKSWVEALRGGKYQQGKNYLRRGDNRCCCLGVLCDITMPNKWQMSTTGHVWTIEGGVMTWPSTWMADEWGLPEAKISVLARMNDNGKPFAEIADWIERNV